MAESLDDGEFWLPAQFLADDDILMDKGNLKNCCNKEGVTTRFGFSSHGFDLFGPSSDLSSPVESVIGSTETESDEEDYLAGLTRQIVHTALQEEFEKFDQGFVYENKKTWCMAGSPQSTLCAVGGGCGCKQGSSRGSPIGPSRVSSPPSTWDLLYAAAGEVAQMRLSDEDYGCQQGRGLLAPAPPSKPSPISVPLKNFDPDACFYSNHSISHQQFQATQFQQLKQQQMMKQRNQAVWAGQQKGTGLYQPQRMIQNRGKHNNVFTGSSRPLDLSLTAWPPLQAQQPQQGGSGMRAVFLGTHGSKKECSGTGVFLPRRVGNPPETRKKSGCSTVLLPARVVQALNLNLEDVGSEYQFHSRFNGSLVRDTDAAAALKIRSSYGFVSQQKRLFRQPAMNHEIPLPQEWTY